MNRLLRRASVAVATAALAVIASPAAAGAHGNPPSVVPVDASAFGHSYGEWSAKWWQWSYSLPTRRHPLFDTAGCAAGQSGKVWFLGGTFTLVGQAPAVGQAERTCNVPAGKALFFPLLNSEWDNVCPPIDPPAGVRELRRLAAQSLVGATGLQATIDGRNVANVDDFRVQSPTFKVTIPAGSIWKFFGCSVTPGSYRPVVADGWYLLVRPLAQGRHTIHFEAEAPGVLQLDITYHLNVG